MPRLRLLLVWLLALLAAAGAPALAQAYPERPQGPVLDQAGIIPDSDEAALARKLIDYNRATGRAVMVATVASLDGQEIQDYGVALGHKWGVGGRSTDQGLILLVAPNERKVRIEVGYGLEQFLPDVLAGRIVRDTIVPRFKAGDFSGGVTAGTDAILAQLSRDPAEAKAVAEAAAAAAAQRTSGNDPGFGSAIFWIVLIGFFMLMFGRRRGYRRSGIDPGIVLWGASEVARHMGGRGGGFDFGGGGSSGGSDWGGFGGGDFGGGGASGDW